MLIRVRVKTEAKKESVIELDNKQLQISVKEPAKENAANRRTVELVAEHYSVSPKKVRIMRGHKAPSKLVTIAGL
jgi:uncharacterized protein (TIGR00251 family)